ncbi:hypothetical protein [Treponema sp.]|uniref:hypothetical protein n=1 Tax=Treponema sp. TaxID=166 RepID=UPI00388E378E
MSSVADFIKIPKTDSCKHLQLGMRYSSFVRWAGFYLPNFSEDKRFPAGSDEDMVFRGELEEFIQDRIGSEHDLLLLLCYAISESVSENVTSLNGTINVDTVSNFKNATEFLDTIKLAAEKYSNKVKVRPFLGINSDKENNLPLANMLLESNLFEGIELYGRKYIENPEKFLSIFKTARKMGIKSRISCFGFKGMKNQEDIFEILLNLRPTHLLNPNIALNNDDLKIFQNGKICDQIFEMQKEHAIYFEFSPAPVLSGNRGEKKAFVIREFAEKGFPFSFCTEDMLFLNKSISEFAADLCNAGVFSENELTDILSR